LVYVRRAWTIALSPDGHTLASGSQLGNVNLWDVGTGRRESTMATGKQKFIMSVAYSPDGKRVACGEAEGGVHVFDLERGVVLGRLDGHAATVRTLNFAPDGSLLATGSDDGYAMLHDLTTLRPVATLEGHTSWVLGSSFSPDGAFLATCGADKAIRVWDVANRACLQTLADCHSDQVWGVAFDPSAAGKRFASVGDDNTVRVFDTGM